MFKNVKARTRFGMNIEKYIFMENGIKMIDVVGALMEAMFECEEEGLSPMDLVQKEAKRIYKNETRLPKKCL